MQPANPATANISVAEPVPTEDRAAFLKLLKLVSFRIQQMDEQTLLAQLD